MINESLDKTKIRTKNGKADAFEQMCSCTH